VQRYSIFLQEVRDKGETGGEKNPKLLLSGSVRVSADGRLREKGSTVFVGQKAMVSSVRSESTLSNTP
jgi:hypothetical protein